MTASRNAVASFPATIARLERQPELQPGNVLATDRVFTHGTGTYHAAKQHAAPARQSMIEVVG